MKILILGKYDPFSSRGGIEKYLKDQISELSKDNEVVAIVSSKDRCGYEKLVSNNLKIIVLPKLLEILEAPLTKSFYKYLIRERPEIVWMHIPNPFWEIYLLLYLLTKNKHFKLVSTYHADAPHYTILSKVADFIRMFWLFPLLNKHDLIISTSNEYAINSPVLKHFLKKIFILPIKIDECELKVKPKKPNLKLEKNQKLILFVGRLHEYKGVEYLLRAFVRVLERVSDAKLVIAGDGPLKGKLVRLSHELGLKDKVYFLGSVTNEEKIWLLKHSSIFVLPSINKGEGFGISMVEAMYFGKPVVSTKIKGSGVIFVNKHGYSGIVVEPKNVEKLADAIIKLLMDEKLRNKLGKNARKRALLFIKKQNERYFQKILEMV